MVKDPQELPFLRMRILTKVGGKVPEVKKILKQHSTPTIHLFNKSFLQARERSRGSGGELDHKATSLGTSTPGAGVHNSSTRGETCESTEKCKITFKRGEWRRRGY